MNDEDTTAAQWAQLQNEEHHRKVNDDYREWLVEQGILKPKRTKDEIPSETNS